MASQRSDSSSDDSSDDGRSFDSFVDYDSDESDLAYNLAVKRQASAPHLSSSDDSSFKAVEMALAIMSN